MEKILIAILLMTSVMRPMAQASEVDPHTNRQEILKSLSDPTKEINHWINYYISKQTEKVNRPNNEKGDCRIRPKAKMKNLMIKVRKCLGGHWRWQCGGEITLYRRLKYSKYAALGETYVPSQGGQEWELQESEEEDFANYDPLMDEQDDFFNFPEEGEIFNTPSAYTDENDTLDWLSLDGDDGLDFSVDNEEQLFSSAQEKNPVTLPATLITKDPTLTAGQGRKVRAYLTPKTSIYRDFRIIESPSLAGVSMFHNSMGANFRMGDYLVGSDKLSHFFNRGRKYFKYYYNSASKDAKLIEKGINKNYGELYTGEVLDEIARAQKEKYMLAAGKHSEESLFGAKSTGIASYGDLAANFAGLIFWNEFSNWGADIRSLKPVPSKDVYMSCNVQTGKFEQLRQFDLKDYVNATWDEGMNCSVYQTELQAQNVAMQVRGLKRENAQHCPLDLNKVREEGKRFFGRFYDQVVQETPYQYIDQIIKDSFGLSRLDNYGRYIGGMKGPKAEVYRYVPEDEEDTMGVVPEITQKYHSNKN